MQKNQLPLIVLFITLFSAIPLRSSAQPDESKLGAWYMYFWNTEFKKNNFGFQGDVQYRNWNIMGDLEQLMLRGGVTYQPKETPLKFTLGYAYIPSGEYASNEFSSFEHRVYQEALWTHLIGKRVHLAHRFRYEQRFIPDQRLRTRYRYGLFVNVPFNKETLTKGAVYLALYNELFINGQRNIGNNQQVEIFDRNRLYGAVGYGITDNIRMQMGWMLQTTDSWEKQQLQLSLHHKI
ncbi:MAG: DUF2490 domain-containing protein [Crocinitomicaceae bacterium]